MTATADVFQKLSSATKEFISAERGALIDGEEHTAVDGSTIGIVDPALGAPVCTVSSGAAPDIDLAVNAADRALRDSAWRDRSPARRERVLMRIAELMEEHADELAELDVISAGKPLPNARLEVMAAAECFRYYAGWPTKTYGETNPTAASLLTYTRREPVGVCGQIVAWNYPILLAAWKIAPALAFGNTLVLKPAEQTPLSALRLGELCLEAGVPKGAVNVVPGTGDEAGRALVEHPLVRKIAFTGSTEVGKWILESSARTLKRVSLELGGKSPHIVFEDADLERALPVALRGIFRHAGQVCTAGSRMFLHSSVHDEFVSALVDRAERLKLGHGLEDGVDLGPVVSEAQLSRVLSFVQAGRDEGAELRVGGERAGGSLGAGYFVKPTIFSHVRNDMEIAQEEIFGPVLAAIPFNDEDELVEMANATHYGLAAGVWTSDVGRAHRVAHRLEAGTVWVNNYGVGDSGASFGGFKESGLGRELGLHSMELYTEIKTIMVSL